MNVAYAEYRGVVLSTDFEDEVVYPTEDDFTVKSLEFSPDGSLLAIAFSNSNVRVIDVATQETVSEPVNSNGLVFGETIISFSPDNTLFVALTAKQSIRIFSVQTWELVNTIQLPDLRYGSCTFSKDSQTLVIMSEYDSEFYFYGTQDWRMFARMKYGYVLKFTLIQNTELMVVLNTRSLELRLINDGANLVYDEPLFIMEKDVSFERALAVTDDEEFVATCDRTGLVVVRFLLENTGDVAYSLQSSNLGDLVFRNHELFVVRSIQGSEPHMRDSTVMLATGERAHVGENTVLCFENCFCTRVISVRYRVHGLVFLNNQVVLM
jgi:WD40 repeat protein